MDLWGALAEERRAIADRLATLAPEQWGVTTLCPAWDVHGMLAHLVVPCEFSTRELLGAMAAARGNPDRLSVVMAARRAARPREELLATLREKAGSRKAPPVVGVLGPYTDALVHGLDMWIPLGIDAEPTPERWVPSLDFLVSARGRVGFVSARLPPVTLVASDTDWSHGAGPRVAAPAAALGLALMRRTAWLDRLDGPGSDVLRAWAS